MLIIKQLSELIDDELEDAEKYIDYALKYKEERPDLARTFSLISSQEMDHMRLLHDAAADIIARYRQESGDPPEAMMAVYNYLHEKQISKAARVKTLQSMFKS